MGSAALGGEELSLRAQGPDGWERRQLHLRGCRGSCTFRKSPVQSGVVRGQSGTGDISAAVKGLLGTR